MTYLRESATIDWLTITTFNTLHYLELVAYIRRRHVGGWRPSKVMQYKGQSNGSIFYGLGDQAGQEHAMVRASGYAADEFFFKDLIWFFRRNDYSSWKCTRLDLEVTKFPPKRYNLRSAYDKIRKPKSIVQSENSTLYIGNRAESPIFVRLYEKDEYLRLEYELKQDRARWAFHNLLNGVHPNDVFESVGNKSRVPVLYLKHFETDGNIIDYEKAKRAKDMRAKLAWLGTLDESMYRLQADHDVGEDAREIIRRWAEYGQKLDDNLTA